MRVPTRPRSTGAQLNITPLIDIVFLLIIFFLAASHLSRSEKLEAVELPEAASADDETDSPRRLVVTVTRDGAWHLGRKDVSRDEVEQAVLAALMQGKPDDLELRIRCDREVRCKSVEPLLRMAAKSGLTKIRFATLPPEQ